MCAAWCPPVSRSGAAPCSVETQQNATHPADRRPRRTALGRCVGTGRPCLDKRAAPVGWRMPARQPPAQGPSQGRDKEGPAGCGAPALPCPHCGPGRPAEGGNAAGSSSRTGPALSTFRSPCPAGQLPPAPASTRRWGAACPPPAAPRGAPKSRGRCLQGRAGMGWRMCGMGLLLLLRAGCSAAAGPQRWPPPRPTTVGREGSIVAQRFVLL